MLFPDVSDESICDGKFRSTRIGEMKLHGSLLRESFVAAVVRQAWSQANQSPGAPRVGKHNRQAPNFLDALAT